MDVWLQADGLGSLAVRLGYSDEGSILSLASLAGCRVGPPKTPRPGHRFALRLDLAGPDSAGDRKVLLSFASHEDSQAWEACVRANANATAHAAPRVSLAKRRLTESIVISTFAYFGVLLRIWLKDFSIYISVPPCVGPAAACAPHVDLLGTIGHGFFLQNMLGSALMGFVKNRRCDSNSTLALMSTGLTTGLCGCLTTFATWMGGVNAGPSSPRIRVLVFAARTLNTKGHSRVTPSLR